MLRRDGGSGKPDRRLPLGAEPALHHRQEDSVDEEFDELNGRARRDADEQTEHSTDVSQQSVPLQKHTPTHV
jgi:hypothetical protein